MFEHNDEEKEKLLVHAYIVNVKDRAGERTVLLDSEVKVFSLLYKTAETKDFKMESIYGYIYNSKVLVELVIRFSDGKLKIEEVN